MKNTTEKDMAKSFSSKRFTSYVMEKDKKDGDARVTRVKFGDVTFQGKHTTEFKESETQRIPTKYKKMV